MRQLTVLYYQYGVKEAVTVNVPHTLKGLQNLVGGLIEALHLFDNVVLIQNQEGKIKNLPSNRIVGAELICGNFFVVAENRLGEFIKLTDAQAGKVAALMEDAFQLPDAFLAATGGE